MKKSDPKALAKAKAIQDAIENIRRNPIFSVLKTWTYINRYKGGASCPSSGWAVVRETGDIYLNWDRLARSDEWEFVIAATLLHFGLGHFKGPLDPDWSLACSAFVYRFITDLKIGRAPREIHGELSIITGNEQRIYERIKAHPEVKAKLAGTSIAGPFTAALLESPERGGEKSLSRQRKWESILAQSLAQAARRAIEVASSRVESMDADATQRRKKKSEIAKEWFLTSFPLLGALAAGFEIIEDPSRCQSLNITTAAVVPSSGLIYVNPNNIQSDDEMKFVLVHEILHVALKHTERCEGRDAYLWNVACDYVINHWLVEMRIGSLPQAVLYDEELKGLSAEAVYDVTVKDLRKFRKLATFRGKGEKDMIGPSDSGFVGPRVGVDLDTFYRSALAQGYEFHRATGRGHLPAGMVEEIEAALVPPLPWDVQLAHWFDEHFQPPEKHRTYARASRRQASSPDIPRPVLTFKEDCRRSHTFGVVLDTSGSMDKRILAQGLGAIISYALAKEVQSVRLVFCDAAAYDVGYVCPESLLERVEVQGRGGTALQPGIELLEMATDFPKDGPILIITDGEIEGRLEIRRAHAFLLPKAGRLPFAPKGKVFFIDE